MENFVFPYKCSFMLIAITKSLNKSTGTDGTYPPRWWSLETGVTMSVPGNWGQHGGSAG